MRFRYLAFVFLSLLIGEFVFAQDAPKIEVGAGYLFGRQSLDEFEPIGIESVHLNGWNTSLSANFTKWLGVEADFCGAYGGPRVDLGSSGTPGSVKVNERVYTYLFGPRISFRKSKRATPFAHVLFGGAHASAGAEVNDNGVSGTVPEMNNSSFAWAVGGGIDFPLTRRLALRSQFDYLRTSFLDVTNSRQNSLRVVGGVVFRF